MSKSLGNVVAPQDLIQKYGADILRLWVCEPRLPGRRPDLRGDPRALRRGVPQDPQHGALPDLEPLRLRPGRGRACRAERLLPLDRLGAARDARGRRERIARGATSATSSTSSTTTLVNFCATTLSAFYLRHPQGPPLRLARPTRRERRSAQTALYRIARALATAAAPVLAFTAEEIWEALPGKEGRIGPPRAFRGPGRRRREDTVAADAWERLTSCEKKPP